MAYFEQPLRGIDAGVEPIQVDGVGGAAGAAEGGGIVAVGSHAHRHIVDIHRDAAGGGLQHHDGGEGVRGLSLGGEGCFQFGVFVGGKGNLTPRDEGVYVAGVAHGTHDEFHQVAIVGGGLTPEDNLVVYHRKVFDVDLWQHHQNSVGIVVRAIGIVVERILSGIAVLGIIFVDIGIVVVVGIADDQSVPAVG